MRAILFWPRFLIPMNFHGSLCREVLLDILNFHWGRRFGLFLIDFHFIWNWCLAQALSEQVFDFERIDRIGTKARIPIAEYLGIKVGGLVVGANASASGCLKAHEVLNLGTLVGGLLPASMFLGFVAVVGEAGRRTVESEVVKIV